METVLRTLPPEEDGEVDEVKVFTAAYRKPRSKQEVGNANVLALDALGTDKEIQKRLWHEPDFSPEDRNLPDVDRVMLLSQLCTLFVAQDRHVRLARAIYMLMYRGYLMRNPNSPEFVGQMHARYVKAQQNGTSPRYDMKPNPEISLGFMGAAGVGKSFSLKRIAQLFWNCIYHEESRLYQLPVIYVQMPFDGRSGHTLAARIFRELDRHLKTNYLTVYTRKGAFKNAEDKMDMAVDLCVKHGVGVLMVDEQQNQRARLAVDQSGTLYNDDAEASSQSDSTEEISAPDKEAPLSKLVINSCMHRHLPLVLCGTLEAMRLIGIRHSTARRQSGFGSSRWMPYAPSFDLTKRDEFEKALVVIWRFQWVKKPVELTDEYVELLFVLTQGLIDTLIKLFMSAQEAAIISGLETLSPELFALTIEREFWAIELTLKSLATGDQVLARLAPDLHDAFATPIFRADVLQAMAAYRARKDVASTPEEVAKLASALAARDAALKALRRAVKKAEEVTEDAKRALSDVDEARAKANEDALSSGAAARKALTNGVNPAGPAKSANGKTTRAPRAPK